MATVTLETLRRMVRELACQETLTPTTAFVERNPELDGRINEWLCDLRNLLIEVQGQGWAAKSHTITLVSGTDSYNLPVDFDEMLGVRLERGGEQVNLDPWDYLELAALESTTGAGEPSSYRYRIKNSSVVIKPTPTVADTVYLDYIPAYQDLDNDPSATSFEMPAHAWRWAALGAASDCLDKENDTAASAALQAKLGRAEQRIRAKGGRRDRRCPRIHDTRGDRAGILRRGGSKLWSST